MGRTTVIRKRSFARRADTLALSRARGAHIALQVALLVALVAYVYLFRRAPLSAGADGIEPATGIAFANAIRADGKALALLGVGVRVKIVVNVYAAAFYAEPAAIRAATAPFKDGPAAKLTANAKLFDALADSPSAKQVVLTFARDVGATKIAEALSAVPGASAKARAELEACIVQKNGDLKKGDSLAIAWKGRDAVAVKSGSGATLCAFRDRALASGLVRMYLGKDAVSPKLKSSIAHGVLALHAAP
jgi:hypothetical protein